MDIIIGPVSIIMANSMMGEVTPKIAEAVASSSAPKLLVPLSQENIVIVGASNQPLPHLLDILIEEHLVPLFGQANTNQDGLSDV